MKSYYTSPNKKYTSIIFYKALLTLIIIFSVAAVSAQQQSFVINGNNPLKNLLNAVTGETHPAFVDIDGDNDLDCFVGEYANGKLSKIYFYRNEGNAQNPVFKNLTGKANPLSNAVANTLSIPEFVDIDGDGDYDCFISDGRTGALIFFENTGTKTQPQFEKQSAAFNPLSMVKFSASGIANTAFADVDGDGDYDCLITDQDGAINYFLNEGTAASPAFKNITDGNNPFSFLSGQAVYNVSLQDWNKDGLADLFIGTQYFQNTGTNGIPKFSSNKYNQPVFENSTSAKYTYTPLKWVDLRNDGNVEVFQGTSGSVVYQTLAADKSSAMRAATPLVSFTVFPNPSSEEFVLNTTKTGEGPSVLRITDAQGRVIATRTINDNTTRFGKELKPGLYVIQVLQKNKTIYNQKLIKE
jgi:hypothetical protein